MTFEEQLERTLDSLTGRLREEVARQVRLVAEELAAAARSDRAPAERGIAAGRLAEGVRAIGDARSLNEILDTLVSYAAREAARVGVLLVRGGRFHGWRFVGFGPSFENSDRIDIARTDAGIIGQAAHTGTVVFGGDAAHGAPAFAQLPFGQRSMAVPISIGGQAVAVLYADAGSNGAVNPEALEILTRHASRCLEALTAVKAARSLTATLEPPASRPGRGDAEEHIAARRYARILVSEIKLYHEDQVVAGRRERDLTTRLGGEIARVRALYEQRVPPEVRQSTDYVHEELIRTLADGDASLLEAKA